MIVEGTAIQGPVHEAKFKIGDVVEHPNFGNSQGTITRVVFAQHRFWYFIQQPDGMVVEEPEEAIELVSAGSQVSEIKPMSQLDTDSLWTNLYLWHPEKQTWVCMMDITTGSIRQFTHFRYLDTPTKPAASGTGEAQ